jgi:PDZ domain-containing protein
MFALGIYDKLTPGSLTGGQMIAGTGTLDETGAVGVIGGIRQKMYGAVRNGATWFLAPAGNCDEVVGHIPTGLTVVKVQNFSQALAAVKQIGETKSAAGLPTCSFN